MLYTPSLPFVSLLVFLANSSLSSICFLLSYEQSHFFNFTANGSWILVLIALVIPDEITNFDMIAIARHFFVSAFPFILQKCYKILRCSGIDIRHMFSLPDIYHGLNELRTFFLQRRYQIAVIFVTQKIHDSIVIFFFHLIFQNINQFFRLHQILVHVSFHIFFQP